MILDTSFVIDFLKGRKNAVEMMLSIVENHIAFAIAAPTVTEIYSGLVYIGNEQYRIKTRDFLKKQIILPLDEPSAIFAGEIDGTLTKKGLKIQRADSMIAGIAISNNMSVLTNDSHFDRIEGLEIQKY